MVDESILPEGVRKIKVEKGRKYSVCSCGKSKVIPICDNSHRECNKEKSTNYKSVKFWSEKDTELYVYSTSWDNEEE